MTRRLRGETRVHRTRGSRLRRRAAPAACWLLLAAAGWFLLAPTAVGGYDSYVITDGTSMLPHIHGGALVITRRESTYHVGEVVAYHNAQLGGAVVLHRIVAIDAGRYTFKGDNNSDTDLDPPTGSALVGREWVYTPSGGRLLRNLRVPWVGAGVMGALTMFAFADLGRATPTDRRRRPGRSGRRSTSTLRPRIGAPS